MKVFAVPTDYYIATRERQVVWLVQHGFQPTDSGSFVGKYGEQRRYWKFESSQDLVNCLNKYIAESALSEVVYVLGMCDASKYKDIS